MILLIITVTIMIRIIILIPILCTGLSGRPVSRAKSLLSASARTTVNYSTFVVFQQHVCIRAKNPAGD